MGILKSVTIGVTATGSAGSGAGNSDSETFNGEIAGIYVNHHANAPATTDITITAGAARRAMDTTFTTAS